MKETKKSLKTYFILVGILNGVSGIYITAMTADMLTRIYGIFVLIIAILYFYYGIKVYDYLQRSPKTLITFVIVSFGISGIFNLLNQGWVMFVGSILIIWYLVHNIKKLSAQTSIK